MSVTSILSEVNSGSKFDLLKPRAEDITLEDIALGLSREARYNGQTRADMNAYSVAEHSCHLYDVATRDGMTIAVRALCLAHDGTETVMGDQITPLKRHMFFARPDGMGVMRFGELEDSIFAAVFDRIFPGLTYTKEEHKSLEMLDASIVHDEWLFLRHTPVPDRIKERPQLGVQIFCWSEAVACTQWLRRVHALRREMNPVPMTNQEAMAILRAGNKDHPGWLIAEQVADLYVEGAAPRARAHFETSPLVQEAVKKNRILTAVSEMREVAEGAFPARTTVMYTQDDLIDIYNWLCDELSSTGLTDSYADQLIVDIFGKFTKLKVNPAR